VKTMPRICKDSLEATSEDQGKIRGIDFWLEDLTNVCSTVGA
jgi:hypothetical protein